jgi:hypothetical protein
MKNRRVKLSSIDNYSEIWRSYDERSRVVGKTYFMSMEFIDIVLLARLCTKIQSYI